ncbi:unnamed protein product [Linum tenue]|uniref:Uncharacterized protein n=1 Tax=Linum tenue TaxID=586396 RepID=A0AAV0NY19_9ROSI|nr:unnamed protein product [Linum tenue]
MSRSKASPMLSSFIDETGLGTPAMASAAMKVKEAGRRPPLPPERVSPSRKEKEVDSALGLERRGVVLVFRVGCSGVVLGLGEGVVSGRASGSF